VRVGSGEGKGEGINGKWRKTGIGDPDDVSEICARLLAFRHKLFSLSAKLLEHM
jgi:hypothetical protein